LAPLESALSRFAIDCKIFGDGGRGKSCCQKIGSLLEGFLALLFPKNELKKDGSRSKKNIVVGTNGQDPLPQTITRLYWNSQLLQGYVATQVAYFSTTHSQTGAPNKGEKHPPIMDTRNAKGIQPNESIYGCWCIMCIP
jgi:hypothetical protein